VQGERRNGGVIWHTQGSGKSLTMALLAKQIFQQIHNPKILVVTDRVDLDDQISETFRKVDVPVKNAKTGNHLAELLQSKTDAVVTTIVNKFEAALKKMEPLTTPDLFVLIDEGHRTQYGTFNVKMQKVLPNACFLAFTGTPLMRNEKSTAQKFGGIIDAYTIREAVADGAIVPILYEGRHAVQDVNQKAIDKGFERIAAHLSEPEQADLKRKNSRANPIAGTEQRIHEIAEDISAHFEQNWGRDRTGEREMFKGMVVTPSKAVAIRYKKAFDLIGKLDTEVVISAPDDREGHDSQVYKPTDDVVDFYHGMQKRYGKDFEKPLIDRFKKTDQPELLIVVDKLLTGFDVPRVVVMYLCRKLKDHTLLQAIARVNRVAEGKSFGFIIDYEGILSQLDTAMQVYSNLDDFEEADLEGTFTDVRKELEKLPAAHSDLLDIFKSITNKMDLVAYSNLLADEAIRTEFYQKFSAFARLLKIALSSIDFERETDEKLKDLYKKHLIWFAKLRNQVIEVHSEQVDFKQYEKQLQKLLDQHVTTDEVIRITEQVNILDTEAFEREIERLEGDRARAETIASRTAKHITAHMDEDPTFFKRLSELIQETIADMRALRISEAAALAELKALAEQAVTRNSDDIPQDLSGRDYAVPFYRYMKTMTDCTEAQGVRFALETDAIVQRYKIIDWQQKPDVVKKMSFFISEYLIDEHKIAVNKAEDIANECVNMAKKRYT
jgi:type I restriction enzyme, R subunit